MRQNQLVQRALKLFLAVGLLALLSSSSVLASAPAGYYDTVDASNAAALRGTVHNVIKDHTKIPYTSSSTDTWNVLELADQDPNDSSRILDVYLNASFPKYGGGNTDYNREHTWPKSYGFPNDGVDNYPYTDCHQLFLCNDSRNSSRSNKPYGTVGGSGTTEYVTEVNNGVGGGSGSYPGWSCWANPTYWETWWDRRGDVARAQFYMDVRYEGGNHGITGYAEPDLILTDNLTLIQNSNQGTNLSVAYMGLLSTLLQWNQDDPVDAKEMVRNDAVFSIQGNRNPFIDHPEWIDCIFSGTCGGGTDTTPPAAPTGLIATAGDGTVGLDWADNGEADLAGYSVYRSTTTAGPYSPISAGLVGISQFTDTGLTNDTTYYYVVTASDLSLNESVASLEASATPAVGAGSGGGTVVWINEFHYDNVGTDTGEFFEIAGPAGTSLTGWTLVGYNGNGGVTYATVNLSGVLPDQQNGYGTLSFNLVGIQNGAPDGLALVDGVGTVIEFISYEGVVNATAGPAAGLASTDIGVAETADTPVGYSLQLGGVGNTSGDFNWQSELVNTKGAVNTGQSFVGAVNQAPVAVANGPYTGETDLAVVFSSLGSADPDGTIATYAWDFGDGGSSSLANPSHVYLASGNYTVTLTVTDDQAAADTDSTVANIANPSAVGLPGVLTTSITGIYPNPFNPATNIRLVVGRAGPVSVEIFSVKGERVRSLLNEDRAAGEFTLRWNGMSDNGQLVPSGSYFCRVRNGGVTDTQSLLLLK